MINVIKFICKKCGIECVIYTDINTFNNEKLCSKCRDGTIASASH